MKANDKPQISMHNTTSDRCDYWAGKVRDFLAAVGLFAVLLAIAYWVTSP